MLEILTTQHRADSKFFSIKELLDKVCKKLIRFNNKVELTENAKQAILNSITMYIGMEPIYVWQNKNGIYEVLKKEDSGKINCFIEIEKFLQKKETRYKNRFYDKIIQVVVFHGNYHDKATTLKILTGRVIV